jgi:hypothetical protein
MAPLLAPILNIIMDKGEIMDKLHCCCRWEGSVPITPYCLTSKKAKGRT